MELNEDFKEQPKEETKENNDKKVLTFGGENVQSISFTQIFKYASGKEKLWIYIGILSSIIQGFVFPVVIYNIATMSDSFISYVINHAIKKDTGINNDSLLKELIDNMVSGNFANVGNLQTIYPDYDFKQFTNNTTNSSKYFDFTKSFIFKTEEEILHSLNHSFMVIAFLSLFAFVTTFIYYISLDVSATRQCTKIRSLVFRSILRQDIPWHERTNPGELSSRIINDSLLIEDGIGSKMGSLFQNLSSAVILIVLAFVTDWKLSLYLFGAFVLVTTGVSTMSALLANITKKNQEAYAVAGGIAQETFSQIRTVVSFGMQQKECERYTKNLLPSLKLGIKKSHVSGLCMGSVFCIAYICYSVAFVKGGQFVYGGALVPADVFKVLLGIMFGSLSLGACGGAAAALGAATGSASILFHIIDRKSITGIEPEINPNNVDSDGNANPNTTTITTTTTTTTNALEESGGSSETSLKGHIEFKNVHFTYPSRPDTEILKGISFQCHSGQTIALVGASGSGKSTIVQLLERFYEKSEGEIWIDGKKIEEYNVAWLRSQMGLVSQEPILFDTTIAENIAISCPGVSMDQIEEAAKLANAHGFISKLDQGYQTRAGEKGLQLSGGQKQRICIARALLSHPPILLLDEATSALDNQSEKLVQDALDSVSKGRTTIVIAHRLTTIKNADMIMVMDHGTIVEFGTHEELMAKESVYYHLVKNQELSSSSHNNLPDKNRTVTEDEEIMDDVNENTLVTNNDEDITEGIEDDVDDIIEKVDNGNEQENENENENENEIEEVDDIRTPLLKKSNKKNKSKSSSKNLSRFLDYNKPVLFQNILGVMGSMLNGCMQPLSAYIYACATNAFTKPGDGLLAESKFWGLMFIGIALANFLSAYLKNYGLSAAGEYLSFVFRRDMYSSMIQQEIGYFDTCAMVETNTTDGKHQNKKKTSSSSSSSSPSDASHNASVLTAKLTTESALVQDLNINFGTLLEIATGVIVCFTIAFWYGWKLSIILIVFVPFLFSGAYIQMTCMIDKSDEKRRTFETTTKVAVEAMSGIKTVYALNLQDRFSQLYDDQLIEPGKRLEHHHLKNSFGNAFGECVKNLAYVIGFSCGFIFMKKDELSFENMTKIVMAIIYTAGNVGQASTAGPGYAKAVDAFHRIIRIIDRQPKIDARHPKGIKKDPESFKGDLQFNHLRFSYPSRPDLTVLRLDQDTIEVPPGKTLALVGGSGCGKSTLIGLLLRWYDARSGEILVDGKKNTEYHLQWLREQMSIVSQEPSLFNISIKDNIRYGKAEATDAEIEEAAKKANIHEFIESLPDGYDTMVGGEGTSQLSGGQKQRIAIARALIRDPKILLLDEATSALDADSESMVQQALEKASHHRTIITIAHRLSTIKNADLIIVMKEGRILERGSHAELLEKRGEYYKMVYSQGKN